MRASVRCWTSWACPPPLPLIAAPSQSILPHGWAEPRAVARCNLEHGGDGQYCMCVSCVVLYLGTSGCMCRSCTMRVERRDSCDG